jgi:hypothetical protein
MVRADCAKASRNSFKEELKRMMMEEFSRKRQAKADDVNDGEDVVYPSHDFNDVMKGGIAHPESTIQGSSQHMRRQALTKLFNLVFNHFVDGEGEDKDRESDEDNDKDDNGKF